MNKKAKYRPNTKFIRSFLDKYNINISNWQETIEVKKLKTRSFKTFIKGNTKYEFKKFEDLANGINLWLDKHKLQERINVEDLLVGGSTQLPEARLINNTMKEVIDYYDFPSFMFENNTIIYSDHKITSLGATTLDILMKNLFNSESSPKYSKNNKSQVFNKIDTMKKIADINNRLETLREFHQTFIFACDINIPIMILDHDIESGFDHPAQYDVYDVKAVYRSYTVIAINSKNFKNVSLTYNSPYTLGELKTIVQKFPFKNTQDGSSESCLDLEGVQKLAKKFYQDNNVQYISGFQEHRGVISYRDT